MVSPIDYKNLSCRFWAVGTHSYFFNQKTQITSPTPTMLPAMAPPLTHPKVSEGGYNGKLKVPMRPHINETLTSENDEVS